MDQGFTATTAGITVSVRAFYLDDESKPEASKYVWAYHIEILNGGAESVKLLRRTWLITDALGRTQHVHGEGVVGEQPELAPGERFEYTSGAPLGTSSGFMTGAFHMIALPGGRAFDVAIPTFSLDSPFQDRQVH